MNPLLPLDDAREQLLAMMPAPTARDTLALADAWGRVLAKPLQASVAVPPEANSAMDGYALNTADLDGTDNLPVSQRIPAGTAPAPLQPGTAARIFTGAPIPAGADAVVMQEDTRQDGERVYIPVPVQAGQNIRPRGQDLQAGQPLLAAGERVSAQAMGVLASAGIDRVDVYRPLRVALLSTGDELVQPGQPLAPGQIFDANRFLLTGLLQQSGVTSIRTWQVADTAEATAQALREAAADADLILSSGGVSVGEEDHVRQQVEALGELQIWRIRLKPGKPFAAGQVQGTPFIGLPGNPASSLVTFYLLALPALRRLQGLTPQPVQALPLPAGFTRTQPIGRDEYLRVRLDAGRLVPQGNQSSGVLSNSLQAAGLAHIPAQTTVVEGQPLAFLPFSLLSA
ncbi:molybdopterin molybdotransferase MoeA [Marinobacterium weihaiense]|uniref:Molybdopterin molybdenumtransferase n=1 Tax=Marinobacterium weihaiense TaxID=2851016 RepID=A0ABS6MC96_9GAMM|nr:gephyrin-like molybdotransferase Glp [Marinobacterium weihaiense]MBV0933865.1 molybdopterin molybdotransferase MoeA [Marinobacterium weihaiense]